ncbi:hypothetical protein F53441_8337 [Fusarium austroafricanum]|uniref:Uncharacterized protein n=1 Tax=Fusarium austroafricanum TaxID=2364996 RepID=A0A8H4NUJ4_9HYPO|nr:hypothetical protein F53441_8337 [Fusarium austroafricanum]
MGQTCPGYRDQLNLLFRDETTKTREKIKQKQFYDQKTQRRMKNAVTPFMTVHRPLLASKDTIAICNFYHSTTENLSDEDPTMYLQQQLPNLHSTSSQGSVLHLALEAVSYAASMKIMPEANHLSQNRYLKAVRVLREAIHNEKHNSDETLYGILLLCGYETMTGQSCMPSAWGAHVDGAQALMKLRANNLDTPLSRGMFAFIRRNVVMSQMQTCQPVEKFFTQNVACEDPESRLISLAANIPALQHQASHIGHLEKNAIEKSAYNVNELDLKLSAWARNVPPSWSYATALNINDAHLYAPRVVHRYSHFYIARVWNFYRISRLILQSIQLRLPGTDTRETENRIAGLVDDICATVPYLLGHNLSKMKLHFTDKQVPPVVKSSAVKGNRDTGRLSLIWPLYVASSASSIPLAQRDWMRSQLQLLTEDGIPLAKSVCGAESQILLGRPEIFRFDCV